MKCDTGSFEREVLKASLPVLVEFGSTWCPPCRVLEPLLERLGAERSGRIRVVTVDIDASPELGARYGIRGVPTLIAFVAGAEVTRQLGLLGRDALATLATRVEGAAERAASAP